MKEFFCGIKMDLDVDFDDLRQELTAIPLSPMTIDTQNRIMSLVWAMAAIDPRLTYYVLVSADETGKPHITSLNKKFQDAGLRVMIMEEGRDEDGYRIPKSIRLMPS